MDNKIKYLEMIQVIINRMAGNSFLLKGWSVTLVSAIVALAASGRDKRFILIAFLPLVMFWMLDGYFLRQERLYRTLYDKVRAMDEKSIDFSMNPSPFVSEIPSWLATAFSKTLLIFYGAIVVAILVVTIMTNI